MKINRKIKDKGRIQPNHGESIEEGQTAASTGPEVDYPTPTELLNLALRMMETCGYDSFDDAIPLAYSAWRQAEGLLTLEKQRVEDNRLYAWTPSPEWKKREKFLKMLSTRVQERCKEMPSPDDTWPFGKAASHLISSGTKDAPAELAKVLEQLSLTKVDRVDQATFRRWAHAIEDYTLSNEKAKKSEHFKELRAKGTQKRGSPKAPGA